MVGKGEVGKWKQSKRKGSIIRSNRGEPKNGRYKAKSTLVILKDKLQERHKLLHQNQKDLTTLHKLQKTRISEKNKDKNKFIE